jgi:hypothetical protein
MTWQVTPPQDHAHSMKAVAAEGKPTLRRNRTRSPRSQNVQSSWLQGEMFEAHWQPGFNLDEPATHPADRIHITCPLHKTGKGFGLYYDGITPDPETTSGEIDDI